ncbi:MAG: hypothetical protein KatS3mg032_1812 [Cyclobacteriaceae bacterium]|nr:MAG: hypothetical protein KatS3mg032_1812 [Cyclobacteriaceae bacterium]
MWWGINDNAFSITSVIRQNTCEPLVLEVTHTSLLPFTYRVINAITGSVAASGQRQQLALQHSRRFRAALI